MKFKSLFLGMLGMAAIVSCNNDVIDNQTPVVPETGIMPSTDTDTWFSLVMPNDRPSTYAGESAEAGLAQENELSGDAAVFVYKWDGVNANPESYAYLPSGYTSAATKIIMRIKDGTKKIFVGINVGTPGSTLFGDATVLAAAATTPDVGNAWSTTVNDLNKVLWSTSASAVANTTTVVEGVADGLIKAFAGGSFSNGNGNLNTSSVGSNAYYIMANWDGSIPDSIADGSSKYLPSTIHSFLPNIPKLDVSGAGTANQAKITVQRSIAKIGMNITAQTASTGVYEAGTDSGNFGRFTPWTVGADQVWALGNINKESTIFQRFTGGSVSDGNYSYISAHPAGSNDNWYKNFDNTRVFGTGKKYAVTTGTDHNSVSSVRTAMTGSGNKSTKIGFGPTLYQYATENAQGFEAGKQENSTYVVVGGQYQPRYWISDLQQASVTTNSPYIATNNATILTTAPAGTKFNGTDFTAVPYPGTIANNDTDSVYYHTVYNVFIYKKENVYKYYAWVHKKDTETLGTPDVPVVVGGADQWGPGTTTTPMSSAAVAAAIEADIAEKKLVKYFQGNCFYRVFVTDKNAKLSNERVLVRRNHVYDVNITKILGPGISDPNDILVEDKNVLETDTYMAVTIDIQQWHKITQEEEVKGE